MPRNTRRRTYMQQGNPGKLTSASKRLSELSAMHNPHLQNGRLWSHDLHSLPQSLWLENGQTLEGIDQWSLESHQSLRLECYFGDSTSLWLGWNGSHENLARWCSFIATKSDSRDSSFAIVVQVQICVDRLQAFGHFDGSSCQILAKKNVSRRLFGKTFCIAWDVSSNDSGQAISSDGHSNFDRLDCQKPRRHCKSTGHCKPRKHFSKRSLLIFQRPMFVLGTQIQINLAKRAWPTLGQFEITNGCSHDISFGQWWRHHKTIWRVFLHSSFENSGTRSIFGLCNQCTVGLVSKSSVF